MSVPQHGGYDRRFILIPKLGGSVFPKVNSKSYQFKMKHNNSMELSGFSFLKIYSKNGTPDHPRPPNTPNLHCFLHFPASLQEFIFFSTQLQHADNTGTARKQNKNKARQNIRRRNSRQLVKAQPQEAQPGELGKPEELSGRCRALRTQNFRASRK